MTVAIKLKAIQQWLFQTEGWQRVKATESTDSQAVTDKDILQLAERCNWASLDDVSELLNCQQGFMHSTVLELGWGDPLVAYRNGNSDAHGVYFFNAYQPDNNRNGTSSASANG